MNADKMRLALELAGINVRRQFELLRKENADVLRHAGLPEEAQQFFEEFSFDQDLAIGELYYDQANCFKKNLDWDDNFQRALRSNLLLLGSGSTGDPIALDLSDYQVGYLFHDYFWEHETEDPRKFFIKMNCSVGQLFWNALTVEEYPVDAYAAAEYMNADFTGYWNPEKNN